MISARGSLLPGDPVETGDLPVSLKSDRSNAAKSVEYNRRMETTPSVLPDVSPFFQRSAATG
jgi:hypothetical protein